MKFSETNNEENEDFRNDVKDFIHERWAQLDKTVVDVTERANKQIFITNGAGAIAIMSYLAIALEGRLFSSLYFALGFFVLGVISAGIVTAILYHGNDAMLQGWRTDTGRFYKDEITYDELNSNDENRFQKLSSPDLALRASYGSFGCFIVGCIVTLFGFIL